VVGLKHRVALTGDQATIEYDRDMRRIAGGDLDMMSDEEDRRLSLLVKGIHGLEKGGPRTDIHTLRRLVEHEQVWPTNERPGNECPLTLSTREGPIVLAPQSVELRSLERPFEILRSLGARTVAPDGA
jgi:hypothetical protein